MPRRSLLNASAVATVAADGTATATTGPSGVERWHITRIAIRVSSNTLEPVARVYVSSVADGNLFDSTYTGSLNSSDCQLDLMQAQDLICVWSGADVGANAVLSVFGDRES